MENQPIIEKLHYYWQTFFFLKIINSFIIIFINSRVIELLIYLQIHMPCSLGKKYTFKT